MLSLERWSFHAPLPFGSESRKIPRCDLLQRRKLAVLHGLVAHHPYAPLERLHGRAKLLITGDRSGFLDVHHAEGTVEDIFAGTARKVRGNEHVVRAGDGGRLQPTHARTEASLVPRLHLVEATAAMRRPCPD